MLCPLQVECLCVLLLLSFPLTMAEVPGPCRHSITREHLLTVRHLVGVEAQAAGVYTAAASCLTLLSLQMDNQLRSGCSISYTFIERRSLVRPRLFLPASTRVSPGLTSRLFVAQSKCCFVKAALPWILELLTTHFRYKRGSVNDAYVQSLRALILNIYSQKCVPQINEEVEVSVTRPGARGRAVTPHKPAPRLCRRTSPWSRCTGGRRRRRCAGRRRCWRSTGSW